MMVNVFPTVRVGLGINAPSSELSQVAQNRVRVRIALW
jgi:hypothetical protein